MNDLFKKYGNQMNPFSNITDTMQKFNQFRNNFTGDPKATVMNMLTGGQISKEQFEQACQMAKQLESLFHR